MTPWLVMAKMTFEIRSTGTDTPLLTAIDVYDCASRDISIHAQTALLASDRASLEAALRIILALCQDTDENVEGILTGPLAATMALRWFQVSPF